jgi:TetR/AcrR family transcriptional regulator, transcriptional repressor for nem operon
VTTANAPTSRLTRKGQATRARIVEAAADLMFHRGVAGTSTEDILAAARVSNSQLYHYFADKSALVHAVIEHQADQIIDGQRPLLDELDSIAAFQQWRDLLVDLQRQRHCEGGCPLGSLSSELAETDEPARTTLATSFDRWEAPIRDGLHRMRERGQLRDDTDIEQLALGTLAALQGGLLLTQAKRDAAPLQAALDLAINNISYHLNPQQRSMR